MKLISHFFRITYWIKDYLEGSPVRRQYNDIRVIMENPSIGMEKRKQYLDNVLKHATQYSAYYRQYRLNDLQAFPVVNKSILIENYDQIKIAYDSIPNQNRPLTTQTTSGSTGIPFSLPIDIGKSRRRLAELKYFGKKVGFRSHDKLVHLRIWNRWQNKTRLQMIRENIVPFDISQMDDRRLRELCNIINKKKAVALRGYASSIDLLINYVIENNLNLPSLKVIIAVSEALKKGTRELVEEHIGCNIISQYANQENGILAQEKISKGIESPFYLNHASYFFEILKLNKDEPAGYGELGRIVLTDLFNYAFPMIRYDTGDVGIMLEEDTYSNGYPVIKKLYGRRIDLVFDTKGEVVYPMAVAMLLKHYPAILQWQFIQNNKAEYLLNLIVKNQNLNVGEIRKELLTLFGENANILVEFADNVPVLSSGKRKMVLNNWKV